MVDTWKSVYETAKKEQGICTLSSKNRKVLIKLFPESVELKSKNKSETIPFSSISSIEIRIPGTFSPGILTIFLRKGGIGFHSSFTVGFGGEIPVIFDSCDLPTAEIIKNTFVDFFSKSDSTARPTKADEIREFKQLLDEGIITASEFEQKKKQLLGI